MSSLKVIHFREKCIGCNSCVTLAPQTWVMDKREGKSRLIGGKKKKDLFIGEIFKEDREANQKAADACPMNIIKVSE